MPMCVIVTRDVPRQVSGLPAPPCMLEIAPGVYTQPDMSVSVRERVWTVLSDWWTYYAQGSIVMTWASPNAPTRQRCINAGRTHQGFDRVRRAIRRQAGPAELKI